MITLGPAQFKRLLIPGAIALALAAIGLALLVIAESFGERARREFDAARSERANLQSRLSRATDDEREIRNRLLGYQELRKRGVIGDEHRLDWVEAMRRIKSERNLYDVRYSIDPRRPVDYPGIKPVKGVDIMMSRVKLEASLLHEDDLFNLLNDMKDRLAPLVVVRACELNRIAGAGLTGGAGPRVRATCQVDLVTIRDGEAKS